MIYFIGNQSILDNFETCSKEFLIDYLSKQKRIGIDIETTRKYKQNTYDESIYQPGLDPYVSKICMFQIGDLENQFVIDARYVNLNFLKCILEDPNIMKVGHNLKFEGKHILHNYNIKLVNVWDTMICERILYNGLGLKNSLAALAGRYLNIQESENLNLFDYIEETEFEEDLDELDSLDFTERVFIDKSIRTNFINIGDRPFTIAEIEYGVNDIIYPLKIQEIQAKGRMVNGELYLPLNAFKLENKFTQVLAKIELRGITVDTQGWLNLYKKNMEIYSEKVKALNDWVVKFHPKFATQIDLFSQEPNCSIQWTSPKEVIKFAKYLGICPKEKSKSTGRVEYTVGAKALFKSLSNENKDRFFKNKPLDFKDGNDIQAFILNFLLLKKSQQLTTTFGKEWLRFIHPVTKKVHTNFVQLMTTGRMSSTSPNCQQIPNGEEWRKLFISRDGYLLNSTDFDTQEIKIAAFIHNNKAMLDFFNNPDDTFKGDFHSYSATRMYRILRKDDTLVINKKDHPKERNTSKAISFKSNYGASGYTISQDLGVELEEGELFLQSYFDGFPGLEESFKNKKKLARERGWIELDNLTQKRYFFPHYEEMLKLYEELMSLYPEGYSLLSKEEKQEIKNKIKENNPKYSEGWKRYMTLLGKLERAALNYPIQGSAATQMKLVMLLIEEENDLDEGILLSIHDEIVEEYLEQHIEAKEAFTKNCFKKSGTYLTDKIEFSGTSAIGKYWIH